MESIVSRMKFHVYFKSRRRSVDDQQQQQIIILATKIMGANAKCLKTCGGATCYVYIQLEKDIDWVEFDPFTNPADCEMLKAKMPGIGYMLRIARMVDGTATAHLHKCDGRIYFDGDGCYPGYGNTEYEAVCLAALQLPECKESSDG